MNFNCEKLKEFEQLSPTKIDKLAGSNSVRITGSALQLKSDYSKTQIHSIWRKFKEETQGTEVRDQELRAKVESESEA